MSAQQKNQLGRAGEIQVNKRVVQMYFSRSSKIFKKWNIQAIRIHILEEVQVLPVCLIKCQPHVLQCSLELRRWFSNMAGTIRPFFYNTVDDSKFGVNRSFTCLRMYAEGKFQKG